MPALSTLLKRRPVLRLPAKPQPKPTTPQPKEPKK